MTASRAGGEGADALFVSPHPDDVELFCGGIVATLAAAGRDVVVTDLTAGELSSNGTVEERRRASLRAARILGARQERPVLGLPDGGLDARDDRQVRALVRVIRATRPAWLIGPWPADRHPDHIEAGALVRRAHFLAGVRRFDPDAGEPHRAARLSFYPCHHEVDVHLVVDVSATIDRWRDAVEAYASQFLRQEGSVATPINAPGFLEAQLGRRARWGQRVGVKYGEGLVNEDPWLVAWDEPFPPRTTR